MLHLMALGPICTLRVMRRQVAGPARKAELVLVMEVGPACSEGGRQLVLQLPGGKVIRTGWIGRKCQRPSAVEVMVTTTCGEISYPTTLCGRHLGKVLRISNRSACPRHSRKGDTLHVAVVREI